MKLPLRLALFLSAAIAAASTSDIPPVGIPSSQAPAEAPAVEAPAPEPTAPPKPPEASSKPDTMPVCLYQCRPWYPMALRAKNIEGHATVDFIVGPDGDVILAHAIDVSEEQFGWAAVTSVAKWEFKPGMKDGRPVYVHMQVPVIFQLTEGK